jgi:regulator of protease activity HflC (stomatin/prohibitin superfamily)
MFTLDMASLFFLLVGLEAVWWIVWIGLALSRKAVANAVFMLAAGAIWGGLSAVGLTGLPEGGALVLLVVLLVLPFLVLPGMVTIITQYQRGVLFRFGRLVSELQPGLNLIFPWGIDKVVKIDLRTFTIDVSKQEVITKDNIPVLVDAVVYFNIFDSTLAVTKVANYTVSTTLLGQTTLRAILGQHELDEILQKRAELNRLLTELLDRDTDPWGVKVTAVEIKSIEIPDSMKRAMARQAESERERRAKVIAADGEYQASERLADAARVIATQPASMQLRYLQTLTEIAVEKNSTIVFPLPIDLVSFFMDKGKAPPEPPEANPKA